MRLHIPICILLLAACQPAETSTSLDGGDDSNRSVSTELAGKLRIGAVLRTTANANLRDAPLQSGRVLRVLPAGTELTIVRSTTAADGFLSVEHLGLQGWVNGALVAFVSAPAAPTYSIAENLPPYIDETPDPITPEPAAHAPPPPPPAAEITPPPPVQTSPVEDAIVRAQAAVGFSYWWGYAKWDPSGATSANKGSCSGVCPDCGHNGSYGADCSGYVAKVWQVPEWNNDPTTNQHPYSSYVFTHQEYEWTTVSRDALHKADAFTYNTDGRGHIMLYESGDAWGQMWTYESRGCSTGIVHNLRTVSDKYKAIRHKNW